MSLLKAIPIVAAGVLVTGGVVLVGHPWSVSASSTVVTHSASASGPDQVWGLSAEAHGSEAAVQVEAVVAGQNNNIAQPGNNWSENVNVPPGTKLRVIVSLLSPGVATCEITDNATGVVVDGQTTSVVGTTATCDGTVGPDS